MKNGLGLPLFAALLLALAASQARGQSSDPIQTSTNGSTDSNSGKTALLRITTVDSTVLDNPSLGNAQRQLIQASIQRAKVFGAVEKSSLAAYFSKSNIVGFWRSNVTQKGNDLFNGDVFRNLTDTEPDVAAKLRGTYPSIFRGEAFSKVLPAGKLMASPLGLTKTVPPPDSGRAVTELEYLSPADPKAERLIGKAMQSGVLSKSVGNPIVAIPELPPAPSSPVHTYYIRVPSNQASSIISSLSTETNGGSVAELANPDDLLTVHPAETAESQSKDDYQLPANLASRLGKLFDNAPVMGYDKRPVLIILDDAFPSQEAWQDSRVFFTEAEKTIDAAIGYDAKWLAPVADLPESVLEPRTINSPRNLKGCESGIGTDTCKFHAKSIERALANLRATSKSGKEPVRVVWLPLLNSQDGSFAQLTKVFRVSNTVLGVSQLGNSNFRTYSDVQFKAYVEDLHGLHAMIQRSYPDSPNDWRTPANLLFALTEFAQWYSAATGIPVFINFSWTFSSKLNGSRPESGFYKTALIVAAGNPCKEGVACTGYTEDLKPVGDYDFLRSFINNPKRYIFVANVDSTGKATCFSAHPRPQTGVFAFPGNVPGDCGSSFSAPRIAWMLAAREAYRNVDDSYRTEVGKWFPYIYQIWFGGRQAADCKNPEDLSCAVLNVDKLFADVELN